LTSVTEVVCLGCAAWDLTRDEERVERHTMWGSHDLRTLMLVGWDEKRRANLEARMCEQRRRKEQRPHTCVDKKAAHTV